MTETYSEHKTKMHKFMKRQFYSTILRGGAHLLTCCLVGTGMILIVQQSEGAITIPGNNSGSGVMTSPVTGGGELIGPGPGASNGTNSVVFFRARMAATNGSDQVVAAGAIINGSDVGSLLLETCDLNHDGAVSLPELKAVADACFRLWDTNNIGSLTQAELSNQLKQFFPNIGVRTAVREVNGVAVQVPPNQLPTPYGQLAKHIFAAADSNQDGSLSLQEVSDWLVKNFDQWDQNGNGSLDTSELDAAFSQLARPD